MGISNIFVFLQVPFGRKNANNRIVQKFGNHTLHARIDRLKSLKYISVDRVVQWCAVINPLENWGFTAKATRIGITYNSHGRAREMARAFRGDGNRESVAQLAGKSGFWRGRMPKCANTTDYITHCMVFHAVDFYNNIPALVVHSIYICFFWTCSLFSLQLKWNTYTCWYVGWRWSRMKIAWWFIRWGCFVVVRVCLSLAIFDILY